MMWYFSILQTLHIIIFNECRKPQGLAVILYKYITYNYIIIYIHIIIILYNIYLYKVSTVWQTCEHSGQTRYLDGMWQTCEHSGHTVWQTCEHLETEIIYNELDVHCII